MRNLIILILFSISPLYLFSQDTDDELVLPDYEEELVLPDYEEEEEPEEVKKFNWDKVTIEPNFGLAFSTNVTYIGVAPYVGYEVKPKFYVGPGIIYYFSRYKDVQPINRNIDLHTIGGGVFAQYFVYEQAFVKAKFEFLNRKLLIGVDSNNDPVYRKTNVPVLLLGAGYNLSFGSRIQFPIMLAYDVIQDDDSPYFSNSQFPLYIQIGFVSYF